MDDNIETSRVALKIVFILSLLLVTMDFFEIYFSWAHLVETSKTLDIDIFERCVKYHIISQLFFTMFATFAGLSACLMSLGLIINYEVISMKFIDVFLYWNYLIFGPYLLGICILGFFYINNVAYNCDVNDYNKRYLNLSTILAIIVCFIMSLVITIGYSVFLALYKMLNSVRFTNNGNRLIGRLFWRYVLYTRAENEAQGNHLGVSHGPIRQDMEMARVFPEQQNDPLQEPLNRNI